VNMPISTMEKLPRVGNNVKLHTIVVYREDSQTLYGFSSREERDFFRLLVEKVSGIGPKIALGIMSKLSVDTIKNAIAKGDVGLLSKCPGIGKKTAERLVLELKDKVFSIGTTTVSMCTGEPATGGDSFGNAVQDAIAALVTLGYKLTEADKAVQSAVKTLGKEALAEELIRKALG